LSRLYACLQKLEALRSRPIEDFLADEYLRDIAERNLEVAAQCCIDIANRIISAESAAKPRDYYEAFIRLAEIGVLPAQFAQRFAPIAGFHSILVHEYLSIDWDEVYSRIQNLEDLYTFSRFASEWIARRTTPSQGLQDGT